MKFIDTYDDEKLIFNKDVNRYEIALTYAKNNISATAFSDDGIYQRHIRETSKIVYFYIFDHSNTANRKIDELYLNHTEEGRKVLLDALDSQLSADVDNGYNDLSKQMPIDFANGSVIDRNELHKNKVCVNCESILLNSQSVLGINIMSQIPLDIIGLDNVLKEYE